MLVINVEGVEVFDEELSQFTTTEGFTIELEHSLSSMSKWESIYEKPFLSETVKSFEEAVAYIGCMNLGKEIPFERLNKLPKKYFEEVNTYMASNRTATWFNDRAVPGRAREVITTEVIYYWMTQLNIPFECDQWYFNRLLTLIKVVNAKNAPQKKMGKRDMNSQRRALNAARRQQYGTSG
jgi:hypothetical protein